MKISTLWIFHSQKAIDAQKMQAGKQYAEGGVLVMAVGWAGDSAVNDQIRDSINDEARRAREALPKGKSLKICLECGEDIPEARRIALPGVRLCRECQEEAERLDNRTELYNRKGSKDSQLR